MTLTAYSAEPSKAEIARMKASASKTGVLIEKKQPEAKALAAAMKANNTGEVKAILARNGLDAKDAKIVLHDNTGGGGEGKIKVTVSISCCPKEITITIAF
jgi:predicted amidohydrolase YtcJ